MLSGRPGRLYSSEGFVTFLRYQTQFGKNGQILPFIDEVHTPEEYDTLFGSQESSKTKYIHTPEEADQEAQFHTICMVSKKITWDPLSVTKVLMNHVIEAQGIDSYCTDMMSAFYSKLDENNQHRWSACKTTTCTLPEKSYQICYRVQYPEPNYRNRGDPYSLRQTGVYQRHTAGSEPDVWLILTPNSYMTQKLKSPSAAQALADEDPTTLHQIFLENLGEYWDAYIESLRLRLESLSQCLHYACVGRKCKVPEADFEIQFRTAQDLDLFKVKIARLVSSLEGNIDVIEMCRDRRQSLKLTPANVEENLMQLTHLQRRLSFHKRAVQSMAKQAQGASDLLHKILVDRHSEFTRHTNIGMQTSLTILKDHTEALGELQRSRDKDSKTVKALTAISTLYLPASLVASIFNSNLVQLVNRDAEAMRFIPAPQAWIAVIFTGCLVVITYATFHVFEWKNRKTRAETAGGHEKRLSLASVSTA